MKKNLTYLSFFGDWEKNRQWLMRLTVLKMVLLMSFVTSYGRVNSQMIISKLKLESVELSKALEQVEDLTEYDFVFSYDDVEGYKVTVDLESKTLEESMDEILKDLPFKYETEDDVVIVSYKEPIRNVQQKKDKSIEIKGKVVDDKGASLPGVTVQVQGTMTGVATDMRGRFSIRVLPTDALRFSSIGFKTQIVLVEGKEKIDVRMIADQANIDEVTVVAFGEQKKESIVSSITSIKPGALKSSNSDLTASLAGNVAGVIGWQTGGMPGAMTEDEMNTKFYIRGITSFQSGANIEPLILMDGIEISKLDLSRIDPDDIDAFTVLKDASATAMYGARGANGVIMVTTKKGESGTVYTTFRYEKIFSQPTREIEVVGSQDYMRLYNEALTGRIPGVAPKYTEEQINNTGSDRFPSFVYPDNDWYDLMFKKFNVNNHYALNVRGGTDKMQYYSSVTLNDDTGMIKADKLNQFDPNIDIKQYTFRTNLNINLTTTAKLNLTSFSTYDKYTGPNPVAGMDAQKAIYELAFRANPVDFAAVYPDDGTHSWPHIRFGGNNSYNPYSKLQKGYRNRTRFSTINQAEYIQKLGFLTKGLEARVAVSYSQSGYASNAYTTKPSVYSLQSYDHLTGDFLLKNWSNGLDSRLLEYEDEDNSRSSNIQTEYKMTLLHSLSWGDHTTSMTGVVSAQEKTDNYPGGSVLNSLPERNLGLAFRASYGYKNRYFIEGSAGYNGSERFSNKNKMGFFPSIGGAWVASHENFLKDNSVISFLKLRASYGKVGNDGVIKDPRFVYMQDVRGPSEAPYARGASGTTKVYKYDVASYGNDQTTWEVAEQANLGIELKMFDGLLYTDIDIYQEIRHNIYSYRTTLPESVGLLQAPLDNIGKARSRGIDISAKIQHAFSSDFWFLLNGTFTYNKATFLEIEEATGKQEWQRKKGSELSQQFGYVAQGLFQTEEEVRNAPTQAGDVMAGDIRYKDIDKNGIIDVNDAVAIGFPETPRIVYGFNGTVQYKNFEFSFAFQGSGNRSFFIDPTTISPFSDNHAVFKAIADDHWSPNNMKLNPLWPRLSVKNISEHNPQEYFNNPTQSEVRKSTYFMRNGKFLRCKNLEFAYYVNKNFLNKIHLKKVKLYTRVNNPFVISDFKMWDVELGGNGFNYPIQKTLSVGVNVGF